MATISKTTEHFEGINFTKTIKCDTHGMFTCNLPPIVAQTLDLREVSGNSLAAVKSCYQDAIEKYRESRSTTRKVIVYEIARSGVIWDGERCIANFKDISFSKGVGVTICASVFIEKKLVGGARTSYSYELQESTLQRSIQQGGNSISQRHHAAPPSGCMAWSEEREAFFYRLGEAMESILMELGKLTDAKSAAKIADSGTLALMAATLPE